MKKFDIELAKQGKPVCNGYGMDVRILCYDLKDDRCPIAGAITDPATNRETLQKYTLDGYVIGDGANNKGDLFMKNKKRKMWVNVYGDDHDNSSRCFGGLRPYDTEEEAKDNIGHLKDYIATVPVEWEE